MVGRSLIQFIGNFRSAPVPHTLASRKPHANANVTVRLARVQDSGFTSFSIGRPCRLRFRCAARDSGFSTGAIFRGDRTFGFGVGGALLDRNRPIATA